MRPRALSGRAWSVSCLSSQEDFACRIRRSWRIRPRLHTSGARPQAHDLPEGGSGPVMAGRRGCRMRTLRIVLGDQCSPGLSALEDLEPSGRRGADGRGDGRVHVCAATIRRRSSWCSRRCGTSRPALAARGVRVDYMRLDDPANTGSLRGEMLRAVARHRPERVVLTEPGEWRLLEDIRHWHELTGLEVDIRRRRPVPVRVEEFRAGRGAAGGAGSSSSIARCASGTGC